MLKKGKYDWEAFCTICSTNISIANKGVSDINEHLNTQKHKTNMKNQAGSSKISIFFVTSNPEDLQIQAAEGALVYHTVSHHMSFNSLDCTCALNREIFSGSEIAKKHSCNRTKATAIATGVLSPLSIAELKNDLQNIPFISAATDASNHGSEKLFPLVVQYFDVRNEGITTKLLEVETTVNETSETISELIINQLRKHDLLSKCVAFGGDNCNTNFGGIERQGVNNVFYKLKQNLNPNLVGVGCSAHVINNAIHHGCDLLPVDAETIVLKIYNYFSIYTVRTESLKEFCETADVEYKQLLYHSKTRWLSLFPAIERLLKLFTPLKDYFENIQKPPVVIKDFFQNPLSEAYLLLVHSIMHILHSKIEKLEKSDNSVLETRNILGSITKSLDDRIKESFVPLSIRSILNKHDENIKQEFKNCTLSFYNEIKTYIEDWNQPLQQFDKFDWMFLPNINEKTQWAVIEDTIAFLKDKNIAIDDTKLIDEWVNLKSFCQNLSAEDKLLNANQLWLQFFRTPNAHLYSELLKIAQYFFCIPAHNAHVERIFSLMTQQWTKERNALNPETVSSLLKIKFNFRGYKDCTEFYNFLLTKKEVLKAIGKSDKYK